MAFKTDRITKLMNQYRSELPAQDSFDSRRKSMLEYIATYYDTHKNTEDLVSRLNRLEHYCNIANNIIASLAGGIISCALMYMCTNYLGAWSVHGSYVVCFILIALLAYAAFSVILFILKNSIDIDPYFTNEYESKRIRAILEEHIDEIAQTRLQLPLQNLIASKNSMFNK